MTLSTVSKRDRGAFAMSHDIVRDAREDAADARKWRHRDSDALRLVLALAERQLEQDCAALSGPSITLDMMQEAENDKNALAHFRQHFNL